MNVRDIACPDCREVQAVRKVDFDEYRCEECGATFDVQDVVD